MGSGARALGQRMLERFGPGQPQTYHVFMSRLHWDHIKGFPFFTPVYIPGNRIVIHGCHAELEHAFPTPSGRTFLPGGFINARRQGRVRVLEPGRSYDIAGLRVSAKRQRHAGDSYGWRFESNGKVMVYSTDSEHRLENIVETCGFVEFFRGADLVVFDAMYSLADAISVKAAP